jgi:hypothetical protein
LTAFGIAAIVGAGIFSTIGKKLMEVLLLFSFFYLLPVVLLPLLMPSLRQWFPFQEVHTRIPMSPLGIDGLDYWLGINHGICNWEYHAISWSDYFTGLLDSGGIHLPQWVQMDYLTASTGYRDATALMQGGKQYENLSEGLKLSYTAWTTSPAIGSFCS